MNELLAKIFTALVIDENDGYYFLQKNGITFRLAKEEGAHEIGEAVEGFGYLNQKQEPEMTTVIPAARIGQFAFGTVTGTRRDLGAFVDIGLKDKDVVVSLDELPVMRELWPKKDDQLMIALKVDDKDRIWGELADEKLFKAMAKPGTEDLKNKNVSGIVYRLKMAGTFVLTDDFQIGFIHPSERYQEPRLGEKVNGRVIGVRPDGVLNLSLKPRGYEVISDDALMILTFLERAADHKIPFTDKSNPEEIKQTFGISKAQFKRAIGSLLKQGKIKQESGFTILLEKEKK
ncbi:MULTISPECIES: S1 RNA-binding domain-containing protein [unclassified Enterococcus]|uniref:CvfB family protein n=1 Tax=unclassified Enterococcus TaxID=2608891 RepID=UPI001CE0EE09|nr:MULTISPECIES: S1-like domain-containing RNA-binding protein [unclassified Enterococcus]MCA5012768.1 DNA-binding protein [Enterococcus sp. S23]MCA5016019.1 DNA-binding protein [Enterococcus sp. S22(2020)]